MMRIHGSYAAKFRESSCLCAGCVIKEADCTSASTARRRLTFSKSLRVFVGVSKLRKSDLIFVDPVAKFSGAHTTRRKFVTLVTWSSDVWRGLEQSVINDAIKTSSVAAGFGRHGMPPPASSPDLWPFDLKTGMRVASKAGNLPSKFVHARLLRSGVTH